MLSYINKLYGGAVDYYYGWKLNGRKFKPANGTLWFLIEVTDYNVYVIQGKSRLKTDMPLNAVANLVKEGAWVDV